MAQNVQGNPNQVPPANPAGGAQPPAGGPQGQANAVANPGGAQPAAGAAGAGGVVPAANPNPPAGANPGGPPGAIPNSGPLPAPRAPGAPAPDIVVALTGIFANGPVISGAVADTDSFDAGKDGLFIGQNADVLTAAREVARVLHHRCSSEATRVAVGLAIIATVYPALATKRITGVVKPGWYTKDAPAVPLTAAQLAEADAVVDVDELRELVVIALSIVAAAKVNFWKTNHHTGSGAASGYFLKACGMFNLCAGPTAAADLEAIWRAVHWIDTKVMLACMGVRNITADSAAVAQASSLLALSDDAKLRIASNPAGTAKWADVWAGIRMIESNYAFKMVGPALPRKRSYYEAIYARCCSGDPSLHMGSVYLCGRVREVIPEWDPQTISWVRTCVGLMDAKNTLLKAQVFAHVEENQTMARSIKTINETTSLLQSEASTDTGLRFLLEDSPDA